MNRYRQCKQFCFLMVCLLAFTLSGFQVRAAGSYPVDASLSCYINAMGGVEFGEGIFEKAEILVDENGEKEAKLYLAAGEVTIYSVTCATFIDAEEAKPAYYDENGALQVADYTLSSATALNPANEPVNYVETMTIPVSENQDTYYLWIYLNSNVMGNQFGNGTDSSYPAILTIDWSTFSAGSTENKSTENADASGSEGLSMYPADNTASAQGTVGVTEDGFLYTYNPMVVYICIGLGILFIFLGGIFLLTGNSKKEIVITVKLEQGGIKPNDSEKEK